MGLNPAHRHELEVGSGITPGAIAERAYHTITTKDEAERLGFKGKQCLFPALVLPVCGVDGDIVNYQIKPDAPRKNSRQKLVKYETPAGSKMRLDVPPSCRHLLDDPSVPIWFTEGIKKGDALACRGLLAIALLGVWNWRGANDVGGIAELADWERIPLNGRVVYIAFDSDVMQKPEVAKALDRFAKFLKRKGAKSVIPIVPALAGVTAKLGVDDFFVQGGTTALLKECAMPSLLESKLPRIVLTGRTGPEIHDDALAAIQQSNTPPTLFVRDSEIARIVFDEREIPRIEIMGFTGIRNRLSNVATWWQAKATKDGTEYVSVPFAPKDVCEHFLAERSWPGIPGIVAITRAPVLSSNFTLSTDPGYCPESRYFIATSEPWPIFDGTAEEAASWIFGEMLCDFPFVSEADRAHALALMLLPIVRPAIKGPTPLHLIEAPDRGSGKSLLARLCLQVTVGAEIAATPGTSDEEEWRKKITSSLLSGRPYILLDNLTKRIESPSLDNVLTSTEWEDRMLSQSRNVVLPNHAVWVATSNNAEFSKDLTRRSIVCRIDANMPNPSERQDCWKHSNIEEWVKTNRSKIVGALVKMVRSWLENPGYDGVVLGSFEEWSKIVGGILNYAKVPGFLGNLSEWRISADPVTAALTAFCSKWWTEFGCHPVKSGDLRDNWEQEDDLVGMLGTGGESSRTTRLGYRLRDMRGQVFGVVCPVEGLISVKVVKAHTHGGTASYKLEKQTNPHHKTQTPTIENTNPHHENQVQTGGVSGGCGGFSNPPHAHVRDARARIESHGENVHEPPPTGSNPHHETPTKVQADEVQEF